MNIVLIGYRGAGKSAVGRRLAARLGRKLVSTDAEIVKRAHRAIPEIVAQEGSSLPKSSRWSRSI